MHLMLAPMQQAAERLVGPKIDWSGLSPLLVLLGAGVVLLLAGALAPRGLPRGVYAIVTGAAAIAAGVLEFVQWSDTVHDGPRALVRDVLVVDGPSVFIGVSICAALLLAACITDSYLRREDLDGPEVYGLFLLAALGGLVMAGANDLIVLFLGLETLSIALYVLAASHRKRIESQEAGLKYFILGGFSSAFFLYGIALIYGATGTTRLRGEVSIKTALATVVETDKHRALLVIGVALLLVGLAFKVAAVPFHSWTPDVYQGAPTPVTGFMASAAKAAAFGALLRSLVLAMPEARDDWRPVIWALALLTLVVGSILAVVQTNVKRMLAYSSISHAGFILVGVEAAAHANDTTNRGLASVLFYLLAYAVLVSGTFAVASLVGRAGDGSHDLDSYRGLGKQRPALALAMTVFLLAQAGVPLTSGFVAKFSIITAAADVNSYAVAIVAMLSAVIAAFLYLRIIVSMFLADGEATGDRVTIPFGTGLAIAVSLAFTLIVGFFPGWLLELARDAASRLF
ncbi:MAG: NADH-quinone oxidoreductase subunit [Actinomycetota bacterium]|jgi:NADH-quinone oxidoreductase subunit N